MDYFERQRRIPDWNHDTIAEQTALVLGVGGIGSTCAMALCRLGVRKIFLIDKDTVDARQILFSVADVGRVKVAAAVEGLARHCIRTELAPFHIDAVERWDIVVECARQSTVLFNAIDHGDVFDAAVTSLSVALGIPYLTAASYSHTAISERFSGKRGEPCWACNGAQGLGPALAELTPRKILSYATLPISRTPEVKPTTSNVGSSVLPCSIAAEVPLPGSAPHPMQMMVTLWANSLFAMSLPNWNHFCLCDFSMTSFSVEKSPACPICATLDE